MSVSEEPQMPPSRGSRAAVLCPRCHARNNPELTHCGACGADLLPGCSVLERLALLAFGALLAAGCMVLAAALARGNMDLPVTGWQIALRVSAVLTLLGFLYEALKRTPEYEKYERRAQRHLTAVPERALADLIKAFQLAPRERKADIGRQGGSVLALLDHLDGALEGLAEVAAPLQGDGAPPHPGVSKMDGQPPVEADVLERIGTLQQQLVDSGYREWVGYCPACRAAVLVDAEHRCARCGTWLKSVSMVRPDERERALAHLAQKQRTRQRKQSVFIALAVVALLVCLALPLAGILPGLARSRATPTPAPTATPSAPLVYQEDVFTFRYPGSWQRIGPSQVSALLDTSLQEGTSDTYLYIGGVYTGGLDNCSTCARCVVKVVSNGTLPGSLSAAQYEAYHQASVQELGARLLQQRQVELASMPAVESLYLDPGGQAKAWEFTILPPLPGRAYRLTCSSRQDAYAGFEPAFRQIVSTLQIAVETIPPTPVPTPIRLATPRRPPTSVPFTTYTIKPGDVLGQIAKDFGITMEALAAANGIEDPDLIQPGQLLTIPLTSR